MGKCPRLDSGGACDYDHTLAMSAMAIGAQVPNACVALETPPPYGQAESAGVDPAVRFGRGGAVRVRRTKDRVNAYRPDDLVGKEPREC